MTQKPADVNIIAVYEATIGQNNKIDLGLGDDSKLYVWELVKTEWYLFDKEVRGSIQKDGSIEGV